MKKIKHLAIIIVSLFICINILFLSVSVYLISFFNVMQSSNYNSDGFFQLLNNYEDADYSIWDFLKEDNSLNILNDTYQSLISDSSLDYYEYSDQVLEFIGKYKGDISLVDGDDKSSINQNIDNNYITPLKSVQLSEKMMEKFNLDDMLSSGRFFTSDEFLLDKDLSIPVLVGEKYKSIFKLNDTFDAFYLSDGRVKCKIIGFIKPNVKLDIANSEFNLNNYIVFPFFNLDLQRVGNNGDFYKTLLMFKCEGYLHFNNNEEKIQIINKLENISQKTGFEFNTSYLSRQKQTIVNWKISLDVAMVLTVIGLIIAIGIIIFLLLYLIRKIIKKIVFKSKKEKTLFKIKMWFVFLILIVLNYILAYFLSSLVFYPINYFYIFSYCKLYINIFLFAAFLICWFVTNRKINKVDLRT